MCWVFIGAIKLLLQIFYSHLIQQLLHSYPHHLFFCLIHTLRSRAADANDFSLFKALLFPGLFNELSWWLITPLALRMNILFRILYLLSSHLDFFGLTVHQLEQGLVFMFLQ